MPDTARPPAKPPRRTLITAMIAAALAIMVAVSSFAVLVWTPAGAAILDAVGLGRTFTQEDVDAALLTPADLPGYAVVDPSENPDNDDDDLVPCGGPITVNRPVRLGGVVAPSDRESTLARGIFGPFVTHVAALVENEESVRDLRRAFAACSNWTQPNGDRYQVVPADVGAFGDDTFSVRLAINGDEFYLDMAIIGIRKRNLLSMVTLVGFPDLSDEDIEAVVRATAAKLPW